MIVLCATTPSGIKTETLASLTEIISREQLTSGFLNNPKEINDSFTPERLWKLMIDCEKLKSTVNLC
jgi:hypothetical protein